MFENARDAGAVVRKVEDREYEGKPATVVVIARHFDTDIDDAWDALTSAERLPRWFLPITGNLELGGRYQLEGNAGGTITACEPPRHLAMTWEFAGQTSWVVVRLSEAGGRTLLELEHIARRDAEFMKFWEQFGPGAVGVGWDLALLALVEHLATGEAVDREAAEHWTMSEDGKLFVGACSADWARASIAFGTAEQAAHEAAGRTTGFYTEAPHTH